MFHAFNAELALLTSFIVLFSFLRGENGEQVILKQPLSLASLLIVKCSHKGMQQ